MNNPDIQTAVEFERQRIFSENRRREKEIDQDRYAPWQPVEFFMRVGRKRVAAQMLKKGGVFPNAGDQCLEVGYGLQGWLGDLTTWRVPERDIHGIELDEKRGSVAKATLPVADLRFGDATSLPWGDNTFKLVICSVLFTSILDESIREQIATEISRVLAPGGALLWYDFRFNNPKNNQVRGISKAEIYKLFPHLIGEIRSVTLAPPIARAICGWSWALATMLEGIPFLRTHLLAVLKKPGSIREQKSEIRKSEESRSWQE